DAIARPRANAGPAWPYLNHWVSQNERMRDIVGAVPRAGWNRDDHSDPYRLRESGLARQLALPLRIGRAGGLAAIGFRKGFGELGCSHSTVAPSGDCGFPIP